MKKKNILTEINQDRKREFDQLWGYFAEKIYQKCLSICKGDVNSAMDIYQLSYIKFLKYYLKKEEFIARDFIAFVVTVAKSVYYSYLKKNKKYRPEDISEKDINDLDKAFADSNFQTDDLLNQLTKYCTEQEEIVFRLRYEEEWEYDDIAAHLNIQPTYARVIYSNAKKAMKKILTGINKDKFISIIFILILLCA